jgi:predicted DNA binding protein
VSRSLRGVERWRPRHLTDCQRTALEPAHDLGFYETPRTVTYDDIAAELGCAPTTANELLRRAESRIVEALLG